MDDGREVARMARLGMIQVERSFLDKSLGEDLGQLFEQSGRNAGYRRGTRS